MASKPWNRPYKRAKQTLNGLKKLARDVDTANGRLHRRFGFRSRSEDTLQARVARVSTALHGVIERMDRFQMVSLRHRLALRTSVIGLATPIRRPRASRVSHQERGKLDSLLKELETSIDEFLVSVEAARAERAPHYAYLRVLRDAICKVCPALGKKVDLRRLEAWVNMMPSIDFSNPAQVRRLANVYALEHVHNQEWELRYRPAMAGRFMALLMPLAGFPTPEILLSFDRRLGLNPVYVVAARKPSWRVVWQTSTQGWYQPQ